ncbi:PH domain-containing protein [Bacillus sp. ISL-75]|uniref:PH domain-containing protein n=1 Tax=Bacillus sp. ISL-75 TaxID=2819137 RepID=UPI001BEBEE17|nr:PH domain-containing protein [Bacillus sp. ISL-75]MBT2729701.1 PH domain-containing protein [Bacillus sp. ISL-75]
MVEPQNRLSEKALKVWRISAVIKVVIEWSITAVIVILLYIFDGPFWISLTLIILGVIFTFLHIFLFPALRWKWWRYEVREEEIELQEGFFIRSRTLIPMVRVQHVDTVQGPILRKYKLASVIVHTAATAHPIPALEETEAEQLRLNISKLARVAEDDV